MKKVVLIGAGNVGGKALECFGAELVAYFVDNHKAGEVYCGKPVYSIEKLREDQGKYLLLLTIADFGYRDELIDQLYLMGIKVFYYFEQAVFSKNILLKSDAQVYTRKSLYEEIKQINPQRVCILGRERQIGRFVAKLLEIENFYDETEDCPVSALSDKFDYIFVNVKNYCRELHNQLKAADTKIYYIAHYYDCHNFLVKKGLSEFFEIHKGKKRCFIIGNGPSLASKDLDMLAEHNEICFGLNRIHEVYGGTKWRPDYVCICDKLAASQALMPILDHNSCPMFLANTVQFCFSPLQYDRAILYHEAHNRDHVYRFLRFGTELSGGTIPSGWTVSYIAMELAVYMGFDEIYLLGMDHSNWAKRSGDGCPESPFLPNKSEELITWVCSNAYRRVKVASAEFGFKVYNATRGGCLEEFERVNLDEILGVRS